MRSVLADLQHAIRRWRTRPAFAATAILTLTLGIGVATGIFSIVDGVLLRPLPSRLILSSAETMDRFPPGARAESIQSFHCGVRNDYDAAP